MLVVDHRDYPSSGLAPLMVRSLSWRAARGYLEPTATQKAPLPGIVGQKRWYRGEEGRTVEPTGPKQRCRCSVDCQPRPKQSSLLKSDNF